MLAVTLGHADSAVVLLQHEANVNTENTQGWSGNLLLSIYKTFIFWTNLCLLPHQRIYINNQFNLL